MRLMRFAGAASVAAAALFLSAASAAQDSPSTAPSQATAVVDPESMSDLFVEISSMVGPSVVTINSRTTVTAMVPGFQSFPTPFFWNPWGDMDPFFSAPREQEYVSEGVGSGVLVSSDGLILTNYHVVGEADEFDIVLSNGDDYPGTLVGSDSRTDLALIRIDATGLPTIPIGDSERLRVGQWVLAVGSPFALSQTVTQGIVSYLGRTDVGLTDYEDYIQTDAAINPGNSGGALVNLDGELIGINTALATRNGGYQGIGFAIPVNIAVDVMSDILEYGYVRRGWMGVAVQELTPGLAAHFDLADDAHGVLVSQILEDAPASASGLERGDVLVSVDGRTFETVSEFRNLVASIDPGSRVEVSYIRDGRAGSLVLELGEQPPEQAAETVEAIEEDLGWSLGELNRERRDALHVPDGTDGVVVIDVRSGRAADAGLEPGDLIMQVDGEDVASPSDAERMTASSVEVVLLVWRNGQTIYLVM